MVLLPVKMVTIAPKACVKKAKILVKDVQTTKNAELQVMIKDIVKISMVKIYAWNVMVLLPVKMVTIAPKACVKREKILVKDVQTTKNAKLQVMIKDIVKISMVKIYAWNVMVLLPVEMVTIAP